MITFYLSKYLCATHLSKMSWNAINVICELKLPGGISEAANHAWQYLKLVVKSRPRSISALTSTFAPFALGSESDFEHIFFLSSHNNAKCGLYDMVRPYYAELELFPDGWTSKSTPTDGFIICYWR